MWQKYWKSNWSRKIGKPFVDPEAEFDVYQRDHLLYSLRLQIRKLAASAYDVGKDGRYAGRAFGSDNQALNAVADLVLLGSWELEGTRYYNVSGLPIPPTSGQTTQLHFFDPKDPAPPMFAPWAQATLNRFDDAVREHKVRQCQGSALVAALTHKLSTIVACVDNRAIANLLKMG